MRGGQWQALRLAQGLATRGHGSTLLAPHGSPLLESARGLLLDAQPLSFTRVLRLAASYDLIHAHDAHAHTLAALALRRFVVSRRVAFPVRRSALSRWKYTRAARYIAVSEFVRRMLIAAGLREERIDIVYDGVPLPPLPSFGHGDRVVALDSADPGKGKALIEAAAKRAGIDVLFSKDLERDLAGAALFVYITESEGLGSAALLAMAAGVPVLASATGGLPEVVQDGATGLLTVNHPEQIADGMLKMLADRTMRERLGRNARARVEEAFTIDEMTRNTLRVYEKVLG